MSKSGACTLFPSEYRADPALDAFRVDVDPVIGPIYRFRIPLQAFEVGVGEHAGGFSNVPRFEDETVVEHERQKLIQCDFLRADLTACVAQTLQIRAYPLRPQNCFAQRQAG